MVEMQLRLDWSSMKVLVWYYLVYLNLITIDTQLTGNNWKQLTVCPRYEKIHIRINGEGILIMNGVNNFYIIADK